MIFVFINLEPKQQYNNFQDNEDEDECVKETHSNIIK